jgi:hypothetical protein
MELFHKVPDIFLAKIIKITFPIILIAKPMAHYTDFGAYRPAILPIALPNCRDSAPNYELNVGLTMFATPYEILALSIAKINRA